jgi:hypothetical protein
MSQPIKVYIYCPSNVVTGGTELLHQLSFSLKTIGVTAYMVYYENNAIVAANIPKQFSSYEVECTTEVSDEENTWIVLPEVYLHIGAKYKHAKIICWWLSVDNFFHDGLGSSIDAFKWNYWFGIKRIIKQYFLRKPYPKRVSLKSLSSEKYMHLYQSHYAKVFLQSNGINQTKELGDYINLSYLEKEVADQKEDIVLYNPKKMSKTFTRIMQSCNDINWVPLQNMSVAEMAAMYRRAKLYVDFGTHPGKDRIPREAVIHQCCLLTNKKGSANYYEDVPILEAYKINDAELDIDNLSTRVRDIFENYNSHNEHFENYRNIIRGEKTLFDQQVQSIFKIKS